MDEILDSIEKAPNEPVYLKKSAVLYKVYGTLILFSILVSVVIRPVVTRKDNSFTDMLDLLVGLPFLALFILAPLGLFYSRKSYKRNEGRATTRFMYTLGHLFFCFITDVAVLLG